MRYGVGQPLRRREDERFLTGAGRFVGDISLENQCYAHVVYSDHAHAKIVGIDVEAARSATGVIAVFTGRDAAEDGVGPIGPRFMPEDMGGPKGYRTERRILALDRVRHVGERVAVVIAETLDTATEAAELIDIEYEALPVVVGAEAATASGAPPIYDGAEGNISFTARFGDADATEQAFRGAAHVVSVPLHHERLAAAPLEPRASIGAYAAADDLYTLYTGTQAPH
ncbi:MAG: xanthine dehydrogenase family protein molybdopterin-binding subunit, partial [Alphaproteobacteria bacterium]